MKRLTLRIAQGGLALVVLLAFGAVGDFSTMATEDPAAPVGVKKTAADSARLWAFQPLREVTPPVPKNKAWVRNPIDAFVLAALERNKLKPSPPASNLTLLRRAHFDLTGLPPTPDEVEAALKDNRLNAFADLVDHLLASPHYGERWARHWLDVVRYADTGGFEKDLPLRNAWRYRDYVIRSFNANKPFDRFILEQVAGDELAPDDPEALIATALYAIGPVSQESAMMSTQLEYEWLTDAADTTGSAFLGLTFGCARCHDHKYDPLTQQDYYGMQAIFAASDRPYPAAVREHRIKGLNDLLSDAPIPKEMLNDPRCLIKTDDHTDLRLFHLESPMEIHRLQRGELSKPREVAPPAIPAVFRGQHAAFDPATVPPQRRRIVLAKWLVSAGNPLTARVIVNRVWAWHFGQGIVRTPNDFGAQGEPPTHPELLDWLARDFVSHGWDLNYLHRLIMSSATYQMQCVGTAAGGLQKDPENRLLWHFPQRRLDAETIWDDLHACAGTINLNQFGPPVSPTLTKEELSGLFGGGENWKAPKDPSNETRRGIYLHECRTFLFPMFDAFDPPDVMASCPRRFETTVPTQALTLLNGRVTHTQAREFARRLLKECGDSRDKIVARAWVLAFSRPAAKSEMDSALSFLHARQSTPTSLSTEDAVTELCLALFNTNEFVFID